MKRLLHIVAAILVIILISFQIYAAAPSTTTRFAIIGDFGDASTAEGDVAALVAGWHPGFVITVGDNRYGSPTYDEVIGQFYCDYLTDVDSSTHCAGGNSSANNFFPSLGNHDYNNGGGLTEYLNYFTLPGTGIPTSNTSGSERYYDFIQGPVHFFVIDSQGVKINSSDEAAQKSWLQTQLGASTAAWKIIFFHHPPYSSASHGSDPAMQWPFASWGANAVIAGHDHTYERIAQEDIIYFVNGLGGRSIYDFGTPIPGSQMRYNDDYGAMLVNANTSSITFQFINRSGTEIDSYTLYDSTKLNLKIYLPLTAKN